MQSIHIRLQIPKKYQFFSSVTANEKYIAKDQNYITDIQ